MIPVHSSARNEESLKILLTGNWHDAEMEQPLATTADIARLEEWNEIVQRCRAGTALEPIDLIVIAQVRRNEFHQSDLDVLVQQYPLAAVVVVYGPCCEGERRSGDPLQRVYRVPVCEWKSAFEMFCRDVAETGTGSWHVPEGIGPLEFSFRNAPGRCPPGTGNPVMVASGDARMREALCDVVKAAGWDVVSGRQADTGQPGLLIVDCRESITEVIPWCERYGREMPVVALLGFPRQADRDLLASMSANSELVAKPFSNGLLLQSICMAMAADYEPARTLAGG